MASFAKDANAESIYKELGKVDGKKDKLFESMKDVYMLAFLLGVKENERVKIKKKSSDSIKDDIFGPENKNIMDLVALYMSKDISILKRTTESEESIHKMVEEYANGGIYLLNKLLNENSTDLDNFISVVKEFEEPEEEIENYHLEEDDIADMMFAAVKNCR